MIWIVLVLGLLCIAMSSVALWYRGKSEDARHELADCMEENNDLRLSRYLNSQECDRLLLSIGNLNIEIDATKEKLQKSEFQCDLLNKEIADKNARLLKLLDENNKLRSQLPKRDSKGRFVKIEG